MSYKSSCSLSLIYSCPVPLLLFSWNIFPVKTLATRTIEKFRTTFTVNVRNELTISQIRKWANKNSPSLLLWMKVAFNSYFLCRQTEQYTTGIKKGKFGHMLQIAVCWTTHLPRSAHLLKDLFQLKHFSSQRCNSVFVSASSYVLTYLNLIVTDRLTLRPAYHFDQVFKIASAKVELRTYL